LLGTEANPLEMEFEWNTTCLAVKDQPYQVVFKITDNGSPRLVTFKTWFIKVIGPPPVIQSAVANQVTRKATLTWDDYACTNASQLQIWRRVDSFMYTPAECETGISESLGYQQIAIVPASSTTFTDPGPLTEGAVYCYRMVAIFPEPRAGESIMSNEVCTDPIAAAAPVITKVSVQKTSTTDGEVRISWVEPLDPVYAPTYGVFPFYDYKVWRSNSTTGALPWTEVHTGTINDTTVVDDGINTKDQTFSYVVVLYAKPSAPQAPAPADTSAAASMVRLEIQSGLNRLDLRWSAFVPWSNLSQAFPLHDVYKGSVGADESGGLVFLQAVNVTQEGFAYADTGLSDTDEFCYRIMTRGTYGNPAINEPLKNFSQVQCAQPSDIEPPICAPVIQIANLKSCEEYLADEGNCGATQFANELKWNRPTECGEDIIGYRVYASFTKNGAYQLLDLPNSLPDGTKYTRDTFLIDNGLTSFARCYKITAIDRSGNESVQSTFVCNDNCPYYELPNVFTPNGDGCNDVFSAYNDRSNSGEEGDGCSLADPTKCARFVDKVVFKVYNRWGNEVYEFESVNGSEDKSIFIDWDGRDKNNGELSTGFYYYVAEVTFETVDPKKRNQTFRSWVHLVK
jgi:CHU_C Type IX secretion signal domain